MDQARGDLSTTLYISFPLPACYEDTGKHQNKYLSLLVHHHYLTLSGWGNDWDVKVSCTAYFTRCGLLRLELKAGISFHNYTGESELDNA